MLPDPAGRTLGGGTDDPAQSIWFLAYVPTALRHGYNPLFTDFIHYPDGVNLMWNAGAMLLDVLATPITLTLGPVVAYNLLMVLGPALTSWTARMWIGRHVRRDGAAVLGGLVIGFSPYAVGHGAVHLSLAFAAFVPVMLMLAEDLLWRRPRPRWRTGVLLGVVTAAQALVSEELVLLTAIGAAATMLVAVVNRPRDVLRAVRGGAAGVAIAIASFGAVFGYPLLTQLRGGRALGSLDAKPYVAEPLDWILPTDRLLTAAVHRTGEFSARGLGQWEAGGYLGVMLIGVLVVIAGWLWHRPAVRIAAIMVPVTMVLSLGPQLRIGGHFLGPPLPWAALRMLPGISDVLPIRMAFPMWIAVGLLVAFGAEAMLGRPAGRRQVAGLAVLTLAVLLLVPTTEPAGRTTGIPAFFTSAAVKQIPFGASTMILPLALPPIDQRPMLWSATTGVRFRDVGGAAKRHDGQGGTQSDPITTPLILWASDVTHEPVIRGERQLAARWLRLQHVQYILVAVDYVRAGTVARVQQLVGVPAVSDSGGVVVFRVPGIVRPAG